MLEWILGQKPEAMPESWQQKVSELFLAETGEKYNDTTFRMLGIPEWYGNKLLIDTTIYPQPDSLMGVMWSKPLLENRIRIVALVLDKQVQNNNHGTAILSQVIEAAKSEGKTMIQLEVRKSNSRAQKFYLKHGLSIGKTILNYYSNEDGLMMIGDL